SKAEPQDLKLKPQNLSSIDPQRARAQAPYSLGLLPSGPDPIRTCTLHEPALDQSRIGMLEFHLQIGSRINGQSCPPSRSSRDDDSQMQVAASISGSAGVWPGAHLESVGGMGLD